MSSPFSLINPPISSPQTSTMAEPPKPTCELCDGQAALYCPSDSASLCFSCDATVHNANFLVARHVRSSICRRCGNLSGHSFSGSVSSSRVNIGCRSCSPEEFSGDGDSFSSSSSCVSSTTEPDEEEVSKRRERATSRKDKAAALDLKVEGVLVNWCRKMAVEEGKSRQVVTTGEEVLRQCLDGMRVLPLRVSLAAAFRAALRVCCGGDTCQEVRRVEQISGVPAKLILATEVRLACILKRRRSREDHAEGWAEC